MEVLTSGGRLPGVNVPDDNEVDVSLFFLTVEGVSDEFLMERDGER